MLDAGVAYLACDVERISRRGDHTIYLGARDRLGATRYGCRCSTSAAATCASSAPRRPSCAASRTALPRGLGRADADDRPDAARPRQRHRHPLHRRGRRAAAGHAPRRDLVGRRGLGAPSGRSSEGVPDLPGRRARPRRHEVGRARRLVSRDCWSTTCWPSPTRSSLDDLPPASASAWAPMTALTFATRHPERLRTRSSAASTSCASRAPAWRGGSWIPTRIEREEPAWAAALERRHGPVQGAGAWQRLLRAIVADVATPAAADAGGAAARPPAGPAGLRRPRRLRADRPRRRDPPPAARRAAAASRPTAPTR